MTLVIKTTVRILDTGTCKHQCVTMWTKDFKEYLFLKRFLFPEAAVKDLLSRIQPTLGLGPGFNYLKILTGNRKHSKWGYSNSESFFKKYLQKEYKNSEFKFPLFTSQILDLQFDSHICHFNFMTCQFYLQNRFFKL